MEGISNLFWCTLGWALALFPASIFLADNDLGIFVFPILIIFAAWLCLTFSGSEKRAEKAFLKLTDILMEGEGLLAKGVDSRPFALQEADIRIPVPSRSAEEGLLVDSQWRTLMGR